MNHARLIAAASAKLPGIVVKSHHVANAIKCGYIKPERLEHRHFDYSPADVDGLKDYMLRRSRSARWEKEASMA